MHNRAGLFAEAEYVRDEQKKKTTIENTSYPPVQTYSPAPLMSINAGKF